MAKRKRNREPLIKFSIYPPESFHFAIQKMAEDQQVSVGQMYMAVLREGFRVQRAKQVAAGGARDKEILRMIAHMGDEHELL